MRTSLCLSKRTAPSTWSSSIRWTALPTSMLQFRPVRSCRVHASVSEAPLSNPTRRWVGRNLMTIVTDNFSAFPSIPALNTLVRNSGSLVRDVLLLYLMFSKNMFAVTLPLTRGVSLSVRTNPGTIFGVYLADPSKSARENSLQPGNKMVAGGYCLYSSSTVRM